MSFTRYPKYKPSTVEWLGEVPEHWEVRRLKHICSARPSNVDKKTHEGQARVRLCNYVDVYYNDVISPGLDFMEASASDDQIAKFSLRGGDTIITKDSETADDIAIAAYVPQDLPGVVCGYHLSMIRPKPGTVGSYVKWLFGSRYARSCFAVLANGLTRVGLGQYELENVDFPVPSTAEQLAIASFLDRETAKIDALVAEQEQLIELLKEKRQAVISQAVTKGLDPNVPMKYSGVEWLVEVPEHWDVLKLKHVVPDLTVGIVVEPSKYYVEHGVPALRSLNVRPGRIELEDLVYISDEANSLHAKSMLRAGDIVAVRSGRPGAAAVVPDNLDGCNCVDLIIIRRPSDGSEEFLCWYLASDIAKMQVLHGSDGAIQQHFNIGTASCTVVPSPPTGEKLQIAAALSHATRCLDDLIRQVEPAIALLHERRSALISAAVTGQIDVRNAIPVEAA